MTPPMRIPMPSRRALRRTKVTLRLGGVPIRFLLDLGLDPATGRPLEIFLVSGVGKSGSMLRAAGDDVAVAISHLLQVGYALAEIEAMFAPGGLAQQAARVASLLAAEPDPAKWQDGNAELAEMEKVR